MKVLMVNGSPRQNGNTARALKEVADALAKVDYGIIHATKQGG